MKFVADYYWTRVVPLKKNLDIVNKDYSTMPALKVFTLKKCIFENKVKEI